MNEEQMRHWMKYARPILSRWQREFEEDNRRRLREMLRRDTDNPVTRPVRGSKTSSRGPVRSSPSTTVSTRTH